MDKIVHFVQYSIYQMFIIHFHHTAGSQKGSGTILSSRSPLWTQKYIKPFSLNIGSQTSYEPDCAAGQSDYL